MLDLIEPNDRKISARSESPTADRFLKAADCPVKLPFVSPLAPLRAVTRAFRHITPAPIGIMFDSVRLYIV